MGHDRWYGNFRGLMVKSTDPWILGCHNMHRATLGQSVNRDILIQSVAFRV